MLEIIPIKLLCKSVIGKINGKNGFFHITKNLKMLFSERGPLVLGGFLTEIDARAHVSKRYVRTFKHRGLNEEDYFLENGSGRNKLNEN